MKYSVTFLGKHLPVEEEDDDDDEDLCSNDHFSDEFWCVGHQPRNSYLCIYKWRIHLDLWQEYSVDCSPPKDRAMSMLKENNRQITVRWAGTSMSQAFIDNLVMLPVTLAFNRHMTTKQSERLNFMTLMWRPLVLWWSVTMSSSCG